MFDWSDLQYFLEVHRTGKLAAAARRAGVDQTTVSRRLQNLERAIGSKLFDATPKGYQLSAAGRKLLPHAEAMESLGAAIEEEIAGRDFALSGKVRIGVTEGLGSIFLAQHMAAMRAALPNVDIELMSVPRFVDIFNREADIAIGQERPVAGRLVTSKLSDYKLRLYASPAYLDRHSPIRCPEDLVEHSLIGYIDDLLYSGELNYLPDICSHARVAVRSTSIIAQYHAALGGAGIAVLPCFMVRPNDGLVCVLGDVVELTLSYWLTSRSELMKLARVRAVWDQVRLLMQQHQAVFTGG
ncbi:LysR family transcriptional regulator [Noviherbaspirillum galbum]|uniref:LysR family transcriptional regulator n=1 Tax=Noviherbaspirillum galbum TaxID=2709383 RepID=A0A6B3SQU8_9BURK|nr:LysR family transcriptional regulator [Noviherbaspirillum galbum]NEX60782.1 LysR family transcriptional regulator [Noviherbaspirillum galbum]